MFVLLKIENELLTKVLTYLKRLKIWHRTFPQKVYDVVVTAEDRIEAIKRNHICNKLNPKNAWETCASFVEIWDHDNLGRGPWPRQDDEIERNGDSAPPGRGYVTMPDGERKRVAGDCANPTGLNYISCPTWCPFYQPTTIEGLIHMAESTAAVHEQRVRQLRDQVETLRATEEGYEAAIASGKVWRYESGKFVVTAP